MPRIEFTLKYRIFSVPVPWQAVFRSLRAKMEIAGQMALKKKNSLPRDKYTKYSVFQRESYSWYSKTSEERLPGLVEAAQARKDVKPPRITCDLRSRNSARLEDRRRASTELKKKFTSAVYKAVLGVEKGHR